MKKIVFNKKIKHKDKIVVEVKKNGKWVSVLNTNKKLDKNYEVR